MESVVDKVTSQQKEDAFSGGSVESDDDDLADKDQYVGSIESLIGNNIQQYKIEMAVKLAMLEEVNRMIARSEEEVKLFDQMDEELDLEDEMTRYDEVPKWLRAGTQ
ncbi:ATP-dependent helicase BRM [Tanacetum coccineum]